MSVEVQYGLIAHFFYYKFEDIDLLPMTKFKILLEQAINLISYRAGGKFETETQADRDKTLRREIEEHKAFQKSLKGK